MITDASSLWDLIERRVAETPDTTMLVDEDLRTMTYREYRDAAERAAAGVTELGVGDGTPVSWALPTWIESLVLVGALSRLGAVQNPILPIYRHREVGRGWMGIRFQTRPREEPSEIIVHVHLFDSTTVRQQETLGVLGVNLIYGAFYCRRDLTVLVGALMDESGRSSRLVIVQSAGRAGRDHSGYFRRLKSQVDALLHPARYTGLCAYFAERGATMAREVAATIT